MSKKNLPLWEHQKEGIKRCLETDSYALFWDPGTGKSRATIEVLKALYKKKGRLRNTLIFAPKGVLHNWRNEFLEYADMRPKDILVFDKGATKCLKDFSNAISKNPYKIVVANYEKIANRDVYDALLTWCPDIMVCDESHRCKNPSAKRSKAVYSLAGWANYRFLLTGTPMPNSPMDIFQQFKILDEGETFGKNFFAFRSKYFFDKNSGWSHQSRHFPVWELREGAVESFNSKLKEKSMHVKKDECLDLPPFIKQTINVEMGADQKKAYKEMKQDFITFVESKREDGDLEASVAQHAVTKALRLQQIVSGFITLENGETVRFKKNPRLMELKEKLEELTPNHKVIVWACFKENYEMIKEVCEELNIQYAEVHGGINDKQKEIDRFCKDEECRVFIGNQQAGGIGINLIEASYSIFYSKNFSLENDLQAQARNYRGGSEMHKTIVRMDLVATGTVDEAVNEALDKKEKISEKILADPKGLV